MQFRNGLAAFAAMAALILFAGCGPSTGTVSGEVTVDGQPVDGIIVFAAADASPTAAKPVTAQIKQGKYELTTGVGKKFVQISVPKVRQVKDASGQILETSDEVLPEQYNAKTQLSFEIARGRNVKDWIIDTKKSP